MVYNGVAQNSARQEEVNVVYRLRMEKRLPVCQDESWLGDDNGGMLCGRCGGLMVQYMYVYPSYVSSSPTADPKEAGAVALRRNGQSKFGRYLSPSIWSLVQPYKG